MTEATREALVRIDQILHEAGWDQSSATQEASLPLVDLERLRSIHELLVRQDRLDIPRALLGESMTLEQFAEMMAADEGGRLRDTLRRMRDFVDSCEGVESQPASKEPSDKTAGQR